MNLILSYPHPFEYHQSLRLKMYCSFDFKTFPFDSHHCDITLIDIDNEHTALTFNSIILNYKNNHTNFGEALLRLEPSCIPCEMFLESLKPHFTHFTGLNYSSAGMRVHFHRNNINLLIGCYYAPTMIFALLSLVSYSIDIHNVS